jgi:hypothetical protein
MEQELMGSRGLEYTGHAGEKRTSIMLLISFSVYMTK